MPTPHRTPTADEFSAYLTKRLEGQLGRVEGATVPVFVNTDRPQAVGTAILLAVGEHRFAITAAHVGDWRRHGTLHIGSRDHPVLLTGPITSSKHPTGLRQQDRFDISVIRLEETTREHLADHSFLTLPETYMEAPLPHDAYYLVAGYPSTKQRFRRDAPVIDTLLYPFVAISQPATAYGEQGFDPALHCLLKFNKRDMWRRDKGRVIAPDLYGVSGGGIWWLEGYSTAQPAMPRLVGICIEWHTGKRPQLLGTRLAVVLHGIIKSLGEAAA